MTFHLLSFRIESESETNNDNKALLAQNCLLHIFATNKEVHKHNAATVPIRHQTQMQKITEKTLKQESDAEATPAFPKDTKTICKQLKVPVS